MGSLYSHPQDAVLRLHYSCCSGWPVVGVGEGLWGFHNAPTGLRCDSSLVAIFFLGVVQAST